MHDCFTRELKAGARPVEMDPNIVVSPCDAIVGACGKVLDGQLLQVKGFGYTLEDLLGDKGHAAAFHDGCYVTLRLTSGAPPCWGEGGGVLDTVAISIAKIRLRS